MTNQRGKVHILYKECVVASNFMSYIKKHFDIIYNQSNNFTNFIPNFKGIWAIITTYGEYREKEEANQFVGKLDKVTLLPFTVIFPAGILVYKKNERTIFKIKNEIENLQKDIHHLYEIKRQFQPYRIIK